MTDKKFLLTTFGVVLFVWAGVSFVAGMFFPDWSSRGQFGDLFGAVNALFSGLAFVGLTYTLVLQQSQIALQRQELALQREELKLQRGEMAASRAEMESQTLVQHAQVNAMIEQVFVAAAQARIEVAKVLAQNSNFATKEVAMQSIREEAEKLMIIGQTLHEYTKDLTRRT